MNNAVEYHIPTQHPDSQQVLSWVFENRLPFEPHRNRTRFWVPRDSGSNTRFHLWLAESCGSADSQAHLATGLRSTASSN